MNTIATTWTGIRPLIAHNGQLADPTNPYVMQIKQITSKGSKKMTDDDYEQRNRLEWEGSLYWDDDLGAVIPSDNIERCIQLGAQKSRRGKDVQAAVFCVEPVIKIEYEGPQDRNKMYASKNFELRKGVRVQTSRLIRCRPMFPVGWKLKFEIEFDETVVNESTVRQACINAGALIGLGDWRPKFGRFTCE